MFSKQPENDFEKDPRFSLVLLPDTCIIGHLGQLSLPPPPG